MPHKNAASDQGLHCLLTKWYIKIRLILKLSSQKLDSARPIDMGYETCY